MAHADAVCIGEAERVWGRILADTERGRLAKTYRDPAPADLGEAPMPRRDLVDSARYLCMDVLCVTRGCPFSCEFCYNSCDYIHHHYRVRPVEKVVQEIRTLTSRHIMFIDDNLIGDPSWTRALLKALRPLRLRWHAAVSANVGQHPELMDLMRESGCASLFIGFESINGSAIRAARKNQNNPDTYSATIAALHARGIMVNASLTFGFDQDGPDVFQNTLDWLVAYTVETMTGHILTPYPGTRLYTRLLRENRIIDFDWSRYNTANVVFRPALMTPKELLQGYLWMYREFYSLPNIIRRLPSHRFNWIPFLLFNLGYRKFGKRISGLTRFGLTHAVMRTARCLSYGVE